MDCSNKTAVTDMLGAAWTEVRNQKLAGNTSISNYDVDTCFKMYKDAKDSPAHVSVDSLLMNNVAQCNFSLRRLP